MATEPSQYPSVKFGDAALKLKAATADLQAAEQELLDVKELRAKAEIKRDAAITAHLNAKNALDKAVKDFVEGGA